MRLLWLSHIVPYPPSAGVLSRAYNLLKAVGARHDTTLVAFVQDIWLDTLFSDRDEGLKTCRAALLEFCSRVEFLPIESTRRRWGRQRAALRGLVSDGGYMGVWLRSSAAHAHLARLGETADFDAVHFDTIALAPFRRHFRNVPATLGHHNVESHMLARRAENATGVARRMYFRNEGRRLRAYERAVAADFRVHITCSDTDSKRLAAIIPEARIRTIPNGVDCEFFRSRTAEAADERLVFVGTMNWYPNVDAMLFFLESVWPELSRRRRGLTLGIVGANAPDSLVRAVEASTGVTLHGFVPDVRPYIDEAKLFVCPIRDGGGTKLKLLDAFAMQKCVVAHPIACEGINVSDGRNVVLATEPEDFIERILGLLEDAPERQRIGLEARHLAETEYSFDAIGAELSGLLERISASEL